MLTVSEELSGYKFFDFFVDIINHQLLKNNQRLPISDKYLNLLILLIEHRGHLLTRQFIFEKVWGNVIVSDTALSQGIKEIRRVLNDNATHPQFIQTLPKRGFIFIADTQPVFIDKQSVAASEYQERRPYKFLDYYTEDDADLFFGREEEIRLLISKIQAHPTFIIHGRSGVGKSSIVRAGLMPAIKQKGGIGRVLRSYNDPLNELLDTMNAILPNEIKETQMPLLQPILSNIQKLNQPIVIIFDQFEDYFSLLDKDKQINFEEALIQLFQNDYSNIHLVFVLREDMLAEMSRFKHIIPQIFHHEFRLQRLNPNQACRAISEPAKKVGCHLQSELTNKIINDIIEDDGVDPPQLQIICDAIYDGRGEFYGISLEDYKKLGGAQHIVAQYLERVLHRLRKDEIEPVKQILTSLISADKKRLVLRVSYLKTRMQNEDKLPDEIIERILEDLSAARIIRFRRQQGDRWIELTHDFLIDEVARWLSPEDLNLRRARAVIQRGVENFRFHQLLMDTDAIQLMLPFREQLALTDEEATVLIKSMLNRQMTIPQWLIEQCPSAEFILPEYLKSEEPRVRETAAAAFTEPLVRKYLDLLLHHALWDDDLLVRKAASIIIATHFPGKAETIIARKYGKDKAGVIRRAISMAFIRDHEKKLITLTRLPLIIIILVISGLMWVRLRRERDAIIKQTIGGTIGGGLAGIGIGLFLGIALAFFHQTGGMDALPIALVLINLGFIAGIFGALGIALGLVTIEQITYRHSHWWSVIGGLAGGSAIGALLNILGVDTFRALSGHELTGFAGAAEGALIGFGVTLGAVVAEYVFKGQSILSITLGAAIGGMASAIILTLTQGNLFSGSIETIAKSFAESQIHLETLAALFGQKTFGILSRIILAALEGAVFGGALFMGISLAKRRA
ncbi:MAG: hypothetical protein GF313_13495 [Caldithrix sp.]|nr:hypothetical protein [Caldithrix sp.]